MSNVTFTPAAAAIVKADISAFKRDGKRYADYIREMDVTVETVADHVAAFRDAFKAANPKADSDAVRAYATKVRNGLNYNLGKSSKSTPAKPGVFVTFVDEDGKSHKVEVSADEVVLYANLRNLALQG